MLGNRQKNILNMYRIIVAILLVSIALPVFAESDERIVETSAYTDILELFNEIGYTAKQWQAGVREVPRIEITHIPQRWQDQSPKIPVKDKKNIFFRLAIPGILLANEKITVNRKQLLNKTKDSKSKNDPWLIQLAKKYRVISDDRSTLDNTDLDTLKNRVDIIPPSLSLAQAAEESGWGTSRFAIQGNALFGQWDFSGNGMTPQNQRKEIGNYNCQVRHTAAFC